MNQNFQGWTVVGEFLRREADRQTLLAREKGDSAAYLNRGQCASLRAIALRIESNGVVVADEVGMGKTRIAVAVARAVVEAGGRAAILLPPGLGYQWQDELQRGGVRDAPPLLRSLAAYLSAWQSDEPQNQRPWFEADVVMVSHAFINWRLGEQAHPWRWSLLPELYSRWRELTCGRLPNYYHGNEILNYRLPCNAAKSISGSVPKAAKHPVRRALCQLLEIEWPRLLDAMEYSLDGDLRIWLEKGVGWGLGVFDLVIIDEAHKARGTGSGLSRLLSNVVVPSTDTRRIALTATPVELLDVSQWSQTLRRLDLDESVLAPVQEVTSQYADAVARLRQTWRSSEEARTAYEIAASNFQSTLAPYLLRRDKREDPEVKLFQACSKLPINEYRQEREIIVETSNLSMAWRKAICSAESLSVVTRQADDPVAKRLRLTLGNGHGIAALLDQTRRHDKDDRKQDEYDTTIPASDDGEDDSSDEQNDRKRRDRAKWWLETINQAFSQGNDSLFHHPAIGAAVTAIEEATQQDEKVLVFGRFTRPLRALVDLLNAREMLRRIQNDEPWPQAKVHGDPDGDDEESDWGAVRAAHRQLKSPVDLATLNKILRTQYDRKRYRRERFREQLISRIEEGWGQVGPGARIGAIFDCFKRFADSTSDDREEQRSLAVVARAIMNHLGEPDGEPSPFDLANAFRDLVLAISDRDDADEDSEIDEDEATELWEAIEYRMSEEYNRPQGGFVRLMFGGTSPESRRVIQLAFNRPNSFPRVLVAQSLVGREGLNLHNSCRIVVLLHPEWNPGVVEQQIGRVDRVDSHWCKQLRAAIASNSPVDRLPRIEVRPVIFRGTYDEHNWEVLHTRWDDLRAQLHGIVISQSTPISDEEGRQLLEQITEAAPSFSPTEVAKLRLVSAPDTALAEEMPRKAVGM